MSSVAFKIRRGDEFRRIALTPKECEIAHLRGRVSSLFGLSATQQWTFRWIDEDGDPITITEQYELEEAIACTKAPPVRLEIATTRTPAQPAPCHPATSPDAVAKNLTTFVTSFLGALGDSQQRAAPRPEVAVGICDATGTRLTSGTSNWFHLPGTTVDLCRAAWESLPADDEAKAKYVLVNTPADLGEERSKYLSKCGRSRQCPARSQVPHPTAHTTATCPRRQHSHVGWCDKTNQLLVPGEGWYHKIGENYDLNQASFDALTDADKAAFVRIDTPEDLQGDKARYSTQKYLPRGLGDVFDAFIEVPAEYNPRTTTPSFEVRVETPIATSSPASCSSVCSAAPEEDTEAVLVSREPQMALVAGPSLAKGTRVEAGSRLMPVWEVMNAAAPDSGAMWTDIRVRPRESNPLNVPEQGFEVPMLEPGASGMVCVEFTVPEELAGQTVEAAFDLHTEDGARFGEPLVVVLEVRSAEEEKIEKLMQSMRDMGFTDEVAARRALDRSKQDLSAAVMLLLREQRQ